MDLMRGAHSLVYNLTHAEGMSRALVDYAECRPAQAATLLKPFMPFLPEEILGQSFSETVFAMMHAFWAHHADTIPVQKAVAAAFVEKSRETGARGLSITLHPAAGAAVSQQYAELPLRLAPGREGAVVLEMNQHEGDRQ